VIPIGLSNASATFMALMNSVLCPLLNKCVVVYLDDILVYSRDPKTHLQDLRSVLELLRENRLYIKKSKCEFGQKQVGFLGSTISEEGLAVDQHKIDAIKTWPIPKNVHNIRSFLGLASFYRKFVDHFSEKASPLTALLAKTIPYSWGKEQQDSFDEIKQALISAPVLILPKENLHYTVTTNASDIALGTVLSQD